MSRTVFTGVQVLDATGGEAFAGEVLVEVNRIKQIARVTDGGGAQVNREGARMINGGGATLMPGLIESHMHISFLDTDTLEGLGFVPVEEHVLRTIKNAKTFMDQGFTAGC